MLRRRPLNYNGDFFHFQKPVTVDPFAVVFQRRASYGFIIEVYTFGSQAMVYLEQIL